MIGNVYPQRQLQEINDFCFVQKCLGYVHSRVQIEWMPALELRGTAFDSQDHEWVKA